MVESSFDVYLSFLPPLPSLVAAVIIGGDTLGWDPTAMSPFRPLLDLWMVPIQGEPGETLGSPSLGQPSRFLWSNHAHVGQLLASPDVLWAPPPCSPAWE